MELPMGKTILRSLQITIGAVAGMVIVPYAVNIGTGGIPQQAWLLPHVSWLWPVAWGCVALVVLLQLWVHRLDNPKVLSTRRPKDARKYPSGDDRNGPVRAAVKFSGGVAARREGERRDVEYSPAGGSASDDTSDGPAREKGLTRAGIRFVNAIPVAPATEFRDRVPEMQKMGVPRTWEAA
jgi:hypothetical protein